MGGVTPKFSMHLGLPPNYEAVANRFPVIRGRPIIFAYAPYIYCSNGAKCGPEKVAHEAIHILRQGQDPAGWWSRYLVDTEFRREEESLAHIAEYLFLCEKEPGRGARRRNLVVLASNLASPIYGPMLRKDEAKTLLKAAAREVDQHIDEA